MKLAVCSGSFDPVTLGHLDVVKRAARMFDSVLVAVSINSAKQPLLTNAERIQAWELAITHAQLTNVEVIHHSGLLAGLARDRGAAAIVRGIRGGGDYDAEAPMGLMNRHLSGVDTVFITSDPALAHISSSLVKDVATFGGHITDLVPPGVDQLVHDALRRKAQS